EKFFGRCSHRLRRYRPSRHRACRCQGQTCGADRNLAKYRTGLFPMIGMAGEDLLRPVELLAEHGADHEMRPRHRPEGKETVGALAHGIGVTVGAADEKGDGRRRLLPFGELRGKIGAGEAPAALVEGDDEGAFGQAGEEQFTLAGLALGHRQLAALFDFLDVEGPVQAPGIEALEVEMRSSLGTADGGDQDAQGRRRQWNPLPPGEGRAATTEIRLQALTLTLSRREREWRGWSAHCLTSRR